MKKVILIIALIAYISSNSFSQNSEVLKKDSVIIKDSSGNVADTAKFTFKKHKILVITNKDNDNDSLSSNDNEDNEDNEDNDDCEDNKFHGNWAGIEFGMNNYLDKNFSLNLPSDAKLLDLNTGQSWQFNLNFLSKSIGIYNDVFGLVTGLGLAFNKYSFDKQVIFLKDSTPINFIIDTLSKFKKNKLAITYLTLPILFEYQIPFDDERIHISAGVIGSIKLGSKIKQILDNGDKNVLRNDYNLSPFKLDATARLGYGAFSIFANYSLTQLFEKNKGPELYPFSLGMGLYFYF